jgi:hypothetical protein
MNENIWQEPHRIVFNEPLMTLDDNIARYQISVEAMKIFLTKGGRALDDVVKDSIRIADKMIKELKNKEHESE